MVAPDVVNRGPASRNPIFWGVPLPARLFPAVALAAPPPNPLFMIAPDVV